MKKFCILLVAAALPLAACSTIGSDALTTSPAPLSSTTVESTALMTADKAFDVALDAINIAVDVQFKIPGVAADRQPFVPGTSAARQLAGIIRKVDAALNAATRFAQAGETTSYGTALAEARAGIDEIGALIARR